MNKPTSTRRKFCRGIALAGSLAPFSSSAIGPIKRAGSPRLKLSLAAYSFRGQLTAKPGSPGAMDMMGFIDWCSSQDLDGFEPTSYFFPKEITP
ncbi:MAG TPA: sugar phosphate isomerase/epimerase, partial [Opitutae bacterium]|nr:sugar phosphate isomerase/epimerase [Opitutae bacterium]